MYELVVVGSSLGGLRAVGTLLDSLPEPLDIPFVLAQHRSAESQPGALESLLQRHTPLRVVEATDKAPIEAGVVYVAPPDYHVLVETGGTLALSVDERVQHARPSVDVLFESAADAYGARTIGVVLTGANADGAEGLAAIKAAGGIAIVQEPESAEARQMPDAAIDATHADAVLPLEEIGTFIFGLCCAPGRVPS